jgi:hypothetical protein
MFIMHYFGNLVHLPVPVPPFKRQFPVSIVLFLIFGQRNQYDIGHTGQCAGFEVTENLFRDWAIGFSLY